MTRRDFREVDVASCPGAHGAVRVSCEAVAYGEPTMPNPCRR